MSFTASNIPVWSGNGNEIINGVALSSVGGGGSSGTVEFIVSIAPTATNTYTFSSIPTTYKHLYLNFELVKTAGSGNMRLEFSEDNGSTFGTTRIIISTLSATGINARTNVYNTGFTGTDKIMNSVSTIGSSFTDRGGTITIENVKTGLINCIRLSTSATNFNTGTIRLLGFN